jgi:hypothetical protein
MRHAAIRNEAEECMLREVYPGVCRATGGAVVDLVGKTPKFQLLAVISLDREE